MSPSPEAQLYLRAIGVIGRSDAAALELLAREIEHFPRGRDPYLHGEWIGHAIDVGSRAAIEWMLAHGATLDYRDEDGYGALHSAIERAAPDRLDVIELLVRHGAPLDARGINDWTPAHMAAARDDVDALRVLVRLGADLALRTRIDHCATPLEEARHLGRAAAVAYLESVTKG